MAAVADDVVLLAERAGRDRHKVKVMSGADLLYVDTVNVASAAARAKFVAAVTDKYLGLDPADIDDQLVRLAGPGPAAGADLDEVDVSRVVRPELFHTSAVSGLTVAVVVAAGDKLVPRWRTHLRWADGTRQVMDRPDRLALPDGTTVYVGPDPGDPPGTDPPAWSRASRRAWLDGADPPDPGQVYKAVCERLAHFLDFPPDAAAGTTATLGLWVVLSYVYPAFAAVPYLSVGGPMASGKTRVLDLLLRLCFRPLASSNMTAPALFRTLHAAGGTLLYDEAERLRQSTPDQQELQSMLLCGYRRGGSATRLEAVGDTFKPVQFAVYGPKALGSIAGPPPTLASRCVPIQMFRSAADSPKPARRLDDDPAGWQRVRDDLHALALEHGPDWVGLAARADVVPAGIGGRNYELWQPLLALADWFQKRGAGGLLGLVQAHARASVAGAKDDAAPEADETLLELLADSVRAGRPPTGAELLQAAQERDGVTFKAWGRKAVGNRLKTYGIGKPSKVGGECRYRDVTVNQLIEIQTRYGIDLGFPTG